MIRSSRFVSVSKVDYEQINKNGEKCSPFLESQVKKSKNPYLTTEHVRLHYLKCSVKQKKWYVQFNGQHWKEQLNNSNVKTKLR